MIRILRKSPIIAFFLILLFFIGCAGKPIKFLSSDIHSDKIDFSKGRPINASASGFQLFLFIPININDRHDQAYQLLRAMAGNDYISNVKIQEEWTYALVGTVYKTTINATAYPYKKVDSSVSIK